MRSCFASEKAYDPHILRLEAVAYLVHAGGLTVRVWLGGLAERLEIPGTSWNEDKNNWFSAEEKSLCIKTVKPLKEPILDTSRRFRDIGETNAKGKSLFASPLGKDQGFPCRCRCRPYTGGGPTRCVFRGATLFEAV